MNKMMLKVDHVSKEYILGQIGGTTLRDELQRFSARLHHREDPTRQIGTAKQKRERFLALDDVSFDVRPGERIGIIGRNGAGKSTLLKLISRITAPTSGMIGLNGRVASMLEVGTGFHTELTGRENIYMNGAILGMTRKEIDRKLEAIIDFSECRQFIDTPVKRYSSGMYVKLGFAVAAHLDSEILIMDEVLAVGDMAFQKKCLEKMNEVSRSDGKTILYVSHNMNTIRTLCERCIVLDHGKVLFDGEAQDGIEKYLNSVYAKAKTKNNLSERKRDYSMLGTSVKLMSLELKGKDRPIYDFRESILFDLSLYCYRKTEDICIRVEVRNSEQIPIGTSFAEKILSLEEEEKGRCSFCLRTENIIPGLYSVVVTLYQKTAHNTTSDLDYVVDAFAFEIIEMDRRVPLTWNKQFWGNIILQDLEITDTKKYKD